MVFRVPDRGSVNPALLGDGSVCMQMMFSRVLTRLSIKGSFSLRDDCMDAGGRAMQDAIAEKVRMRGYKSRGGLLY